MTNQLTQEQLAELKRRTWEALKPPPDPLASLKHEVWEKLQEQAADCYDCATCPALADQHCLGR